MKIKEIQNDLKKKLKPSRYRHTLGVVETASKLAGRYQYDEKKAELAALLHDCAKYIPDEDKIAMCHENGIPVSDAELRNPSLLHAKCGAVQAEQLYGISDPEILHAIRVHTTGVPDMNLLDKIIFVSDYIEPGRDQAPRLKELRKLAMEDLNQTTCRILEDTVSYLRSRDDQSLDETTLKAWQYYEKLCGGKDRNE